jgi:hypothetical protein
MTHMNMAPRAWGGEETAMKVWGRAWVASRVEPERTTGVSNPTCWQWRVRATESDRIRKRGRDGWKRNYP